MSAASGVNAHYHLVVFNIGRTVAALDSAQLRDFMDGLDPINALAEQAPGFVWRYVAEGTNNATAARPMDDDIIVNFGVWDSREHLWDFVYRSRHLDFLRRRRDWFQHLDEPFLVLWWVPADHIPSTDEAVAKLEHLRRNGPSAEAFSFREPFDPPSGSPTASSAAALEA
ncbi:MAG TPA: DUF3291 domain-containing protein [Chloroflexota bacterium]|nr:DUF3291 domain-containing protein [Chloroflexota bacterium]